jgi:hypothetical protein
MALLNMIQSFFGGIGSITINPKRNSARFVVVKFDDLVNIIIPHSEIYPLQSAKKIDFELWKKCVNIMKDKKHLISEGLEQIVSIKAIMNLGLSNQLTRAFPKMISLVRPAYIPNDETLNPDWISGFIEGDGSFFITIRATTNQVVPVISVGLNIREKPLLIKIQQFFGGIGSVYTNESKKVVEWKISRLSHLNSVIPHFNSYPLIELKSYNFIIWREIISLIEIKAHHTPEGLAKIKSLNIQLNKWN